MNKLTAFVVMNILWFSFWAVLIFTQHLSPWWFLFPAILNWSMEDLEDKKGK